MTHVTNGLLNIRVNYNRNDTCKTSPDFQSVVSVESFSIQKEDNTLIGGEIAFPLLVFTISSINVKKMTRHFEILL